MGYVLLGNIKYIWPCVNFVDIDNHDFMFFLVRKNLHSNNRYIILPFEGGATTAWELRVEGRLIDEIENPATAAAATPKTGGKVDPSKSKRKFSSFFKVIITLICSTSILDNRKVA